MRQPSLRTVQMKAPAGPLTAAQGLFEFAKRSLCDCRLLFMRHLPTPPSQISVAHATMGALEASNMGSVRTCGFSSSSIN
eukprot:5339353-Karenia_brevis.AAC.1